jgi:hypothetical protein
MAKRKSQTVRPSAPSSALTAAAPENDDLAILAPGHPMAIAGEKITIREFTFREQLDNREPLGTLLDALRPCAGSNDIGGIVDALLSVHTELLALVALAIDRPVAWLENLPAHQGERIIIEWWITNRHFFINRLAVWPELSAVTEQTAGAASSPPSSGTDIRTPD